VSPIGSVLSSALWLYTIVLLAYVIFSWVPRVPEPLVTVRLGVAALIDPVVRPLRRVIPPLRLGGIALDLSVLVLFFAIALIRPLVARL
jgi:YggT family protein